MAHRHRVVGHRGAIWLTVHASWVAGGILEVACGLWSRVGCSACRQLLRMRRSFSSSLEERKTPRARRSRLRASSPVPASETTERRPPSTRSLA